MSGETRSLSDETIYRGAIVALRLLHRNRYGQRRDEYRESAADWLREALTRLVPAPVGEEAEK